MPKHSLLADLVDLQEHLRLDQQVDREELKKRDRRVGIELQVGARSNLSAMRGWVDSLRNQQPSNGARLQRSVTMLIALLWLAGLISGWVLAQTVLAYDGSEPVNIITTLIVLVGTQLITLVLLLLFSSGMFTGVFEALSVFNPAALLARVIGWLWRDQSIEFKQMLLHDQKLEQINLRLPLLSYLAQHFTVALNLGIVAALLYLVTVSDLAFGWYSTLDISSESMTKNLQLIAAPWKQLLPTAFPGPELVETSRFYRLQAALRDSGTEAGQLGTWWIYILMCLIVYGLLPRLIALIVYGIRYDRLVAQGLLTSPGASQVLARMRSPLVSTQSESKDANQTNSDYHPTLKSRPMGRALPCVVVEWSEAKLTGKDALLKAGIDAIRFYAAGGHQTPGEDLKIIQNIADHKPQGVAILAKSWEPPLLELIDFIEDTRSRVGTQCPIILLLIPMGQSTVTPQQLEGWDAAVSSLADAALYVEALA